MRVAVLILLKNDKKINETIGRHVKNSFPEYYANLYSNRGNFYIHMSLDKSLFSFENYKILLQEIDNFLGEHLPNKFTSVYPPKSIFSTRWKHNYIISKKKF